MCGLVGYFSNYIADVDKERMAFLLMLSRTRGKDSTGVVSLSRKGVYNQPKTISTPYLKSPVDSTRFTEMPEYRTLMGMADVKGWMGHTRAATIGVVNALNAHPHLSSDGSIIGCHNGTLYGEYPFKKDGATDSEAIMNIIARDGIQGIGKVNGAWALTYIDKKNHTFNIIRNNERPISYVVTAGGDFAYASEKWMLDALLAKYSLNGEVKSLDPYQKLTLDLNKEMYIRSLDVAPVEGLEAPKVTTYGSQHFFRQRGWEDAYGGWEDSEPRTHGQPNRAGRQWNYETNEWEDAPTRTVTQRTVVHNGQGTTTTAARRNLIKEAQQKREARIAEASKAAAAEDKVVPFPLEKGSNAGGSSTALVVSSKREETKKEQALIRGLHERQRLKPDGTVEVETIKGFWVDLEDFMDLVDLKRSAWSDELSSLEEKRYWINTTEFVLASEWENEHELRHMLGQDDKGLPLQGGFTRHLSMQ